VAGRRLCRRDRQVVGEKALDLIWVPGWISNVEASWEVPAYAHFLHRLAYFSRLILFDDA
jgi:hypothetical protein